MGDVFLSRRHGPLHALVLILLSLSVVTNTPAAKHGMGSRCFRWSYADSVWVLARGENCTNVHLARLIAGVHRAGLDVHDISHAMESADVLGNEVCPAEAYCSGTGKRMSRTRSVADGLFAPSQ